MHITYETSAQTESRLQRVLATSSIIWHKGPYTFHEHAIPILPTVETDGVLAIVRDDAVWSVLASCDEEAATELFAIFSIHFLQGLDNSGFVGWLASRLKRDLGTGVFVVCGQNLQRGGIFDYWGIPYVLAAEAQKAIAGIVAANSPLDHASD